LPGTTDTNGGVLKPPIRGGTESIASRWTRSDSIDGERLSDCRAPVVSGNREALDSQRIEQRDGIECKSSRIARARRVLQ
jgi:hypothetical protein